MISGMKPWLERPKGKGRRMGVVGDGGVDDDDDDDDEEEEEEEC